MNYTYTLTINSNIILRSDGTYIPNDPNNLDYQNYLSWVTAGNTPNPIPTPALSNTQIFAQAVANGVNITSTSNSGLNGIYSCDTNATQNITSIVTGINAGMGLPSGSNTFFYFDANSNPHEFSANQFTVFGAAIRNYVYNLNLFAYGQIPLPSANVTIA